MNGTLGNSLIFAAARYGKAQASEVGARAKELFDLADIADKAEALADALLCVDVTFGGRKADVDRARLAFDDWLAIERAPRIDRE